MDSGGKNRYELLFMEEDDVSDPLDNLVTSKKKQPPTLSQQPKTTPKPSKPQQQQQQQVKKPNQSEKENKPGALNKNDGKKSTIASGGVAAGDKLSNNANNKQGPGAATRNTTGAGKQQQSRESVQGHQQRAINFRQQNGEQREQRNNRRNVRENGSTIAGAGVGADIGARPYRGGSTAAGDRPPRNRNFEGGNRKREYDRQSGSDKTGVKAIDKREGAGAHNWGSVKEAIEDVNKPNENNENHVNNIDGKADESGNEQQNEQAPVEEETKELTLDEWKAQQQQRIKPTFNIRKAGEGEDTSQWKKMIVLNNNKKKDNESEEELEYDPAMYPQRVGRQQRVLDIQFNFNDGRRGGGGFGGGRGRVGQRGGIRNEGNRGAGAVAPTQAESGGPSAPRMEGNSRPPIERRGLGGGIIGGGHSGTKRFGPDRQQNAAPKVNDERQFPTLA